MPPIPFIESGSRQAPLRSSFSASRVLLSLAGQRALSYKKPPMDTQDHRYQALPDWLLRRVAIAKEDISRLEFAEHVFVVNHSGGKDSQAMFNFLRLFIPPTQIRVVHAVLPDVEWEGVEAHIRSTIQPQQLHTCSARRTLLEMVEERGMFPSPTRRQCTSDLKRGPIERTVRRFGVKRIVNCMGMRAAESSSRAKLAEWKFSARNSKAGRDWHDWLPIHQWSTEEVFQMIALAGQTPHWAYAAGMTRLSCCFCIMASRADLRRAAELNPALYRRYVDLERRIGQVMVMPTKANGRLGQEQVTGVPVR